MPANSNNDTPDRRQHPGPDPTRAVLWALAAAALIGGVLARFKGLGNWPLGWDEYYLAQSIQFILHSGLPQYPCGGLYARGVLVQYLAALLQLAGLSAELAPRSIAAVCSLIALPAAYRIARRCGGTLVAVITIAVLAISVWEVEIGRFGRMYAPFQAIFLWYVVFFLQYTLDGRSRALVWMLILSVAGVLTWEGGALLGLVNFLPPFIKQAAAGAPGRQPATADGRLTGADLRYLGMAALLFVPIYWFATADLRVMGEGTTVPPGYESGDEAALSPLDLALPLWHFLKLHPAWVVGALLPLAVLLLAGRWLLQLRDRPVALLGLAAALGAAVFHQFLTCAALVVLVLLLKLVDARTLIRSSPLPAAIGACAVFWTAFGLATNDWHPPNASLGHTLFLLAYEFGSFPDVIRQVLVPWAHSLPVLGAALALLIATETVRATAPEPKTTQTERVLLVILIALVIAASAADTPRHETRYVFFLYPLALIIAFTGIAHLARRLLKQERTAAAATAAVCLIGFALTEDFRPHHLLNIDSAEVSFRQGISRAEAGQYPARSDLSGAAGWLRSHVRPGTDLVINAFPGVDFYYPQASYFFMESTDPRFESWSCKAGTLERWSNLPLLYSVGMLDSTAASHSQVWLVIESWRRADVLQRLTAADPAWTYSLAWVGRNPGISIVSLTRSKDPTS